MLVIQRPPGEVITSLEAGLSYVKTGSAAFFDEAWAGGSRYNRPVGESGEVANSISNGQYATNGPHPTDIIVAQTNLGDIPVYKDQVTLITTSATTPTTLASVGYAKVPETNIHAKEWSSLSSRSARSYFADGGGHLFGYATCHWLAHCSAGQFVGSACTATLSNVNYKGWCFQSNTGSLECGRLSAMDNEYGEKPIVFDTKESPNTLPSVAGVVPISSVLPQSYEQYQTRLRCPTGSPATSLGSFVSKRPLSCGCMLPGDTFYDLLAEIHVPAYCAAPAAYKAGCMLPGALNFDPEAKQTAECRFATKGCTSNTALNYNSYATMDDAANPCIEKVSGCTITEASYHQVNSGTPSYKSLTFGSAATGSGGAKAKNIRMGQVPESLYNGPVVKKQDVGANYLEGCVVAIEGCMDSTKRNYDPMATVNTFTWCIDSVPGCMMPDATALKSGNKPDGTPIYANPSATSKFSFISGPSGKIDGPSGTWITSATLNVPSMCKRGRFGCGESGRAVSIPGFGVVSALNYDPWVTSTTSCYFAKTGCLNPNAVNFGCTSKTFTAPCYSTADPTPENIRVTRHAKVACRWSNNPPPPAGPPPPLFPSSIYNSIPKASVELVFSGTIAGARLLEPDFFTAFRSLSGLPEDKVCEAAYSTPAARRRMLGADAPFARILSESEPGAVSVVISAEFGSAAEAEAASNSAKAALGDSAESAMAALQTAGGLTLVLLDAPVTGSFIQQVIRSDLPPGALDPVDVPAIVGGVIGGIIAVLVLAAVAWTLKKKQGKPVFPA